MKIILYNMTAENIRVNKSNDITFVSELEGTLREECSLISPSILVQSTVLVRANYAYIEEFSRYYYITEITSVRQGLWRLDMKVDVLMTYASQLTVLEGFVSRYENASPNLLFRDNSLPVQLVPEISIIGSGDFLNEVASPLNGTEYFNPFVSPEDETSFYVVVLDAYFDVTQYFGSVNSQGELIINNVDTGLMGSKLISPVGKCCRIMLLDNAAFDDFMRYISNDSAEMSHVMKAYACPFAFPMHIVNNREVPVGFAYSTTIKISKSTNQNVNIKGYIGDTGLETYYTGYVNINFTVPTTSPAILKYEPYSTYKLYIPMYGYIDINSKYVNDYQLKLKYSFDFTIGTLTCSIIAINGSDYITIETFAWNCCSEYPLTSNGSAEVERQRAYNQIAFATGVLSSVTGGANGIIHGGYGLRNSSLHEAGSIVAETSALSSKGTMYTAGISALGGILGSALTYAGNEIMNVATGSARKCDSSLAGLCMDTFKWKLIRTNVSVSISYDKYSKLVGRPYNAIQMLASLNGFAVISDIHLENISYILEPEKTELAELLAKGVIF